MDFTGIGALTAVLAALGGVVKLVLDALAKQDERHNAAMEAMQKRNETFLGNHMSGNTKALNDLTEVIAQLVVEVQDERDR